MLAFIKRIFIFETPSINAVTTRRYSLNPKIFYSSFVFNSSSISRVILKPCFKLLKFLAGNFTILINIYEFLLRFHEH